MRIKRYPGEIKIDSGSWCQGGYGVSVSRTSCRASLSRCPSHLQREFDVWTCIPEILKILPKIGKKANY